MDALNTKIKNIKTEKALKVRPENIKSGVSIFGITGTYEGEEKPYRELLYIQTSGTQYIDTGVKPNSNMKVECTFQVLDTSVTRNYIFGVANGQNERWQFSYSYLSLYGYGSSYYVAQTGNNDTNIHTMEMEKGVFKVDGTTVYTLTSSDFTANTYNITLFANNNNGTVGTFASVKFYGMKIYDNNVLIKDYIPVVRKTDGTICLYDKVNKTFLTNAGTGDFIAGIN